MLYNLRTGKCLDIPAFGAGRPGGPVRQYFCRPGDDDNQQVILYEWERSPNNHAAMIQTRKDSLCLDVPNFGANPPWTRLNQYICRGPKEDDNQIYLPQPAPGRSLRLVEEKSGLCLGVEGWHYSQPDTPLRLEPCNDRDDQLWTLAPQAVAHNWSNPSDRNNWHEVLPFMVDEMNMNCAIMNTLSRSLGVKERLLVFLERVHSGGAWDHKVALRKRFFPGDSPRYSPVPGTEVSMFYDVWSNIHYGYVGRCAGFSRGLLLWASHNSPGSGKDDPGDDIVVNLGMDLHDKVLRDDQPISTAVLGIALRNRIDSLRASDTDKVRPLAP